MRACATAPEKDLPMTAQLMLAGATALGLLVYLVAVLLRPERF
jgi:K+-transporting ATPase KdpF subunit